MRDPIEVWPDMREAVSLFLAMQTQWDWVGFGLAGAIQTGLKYPSLPAVAASLKIDMTPAIFNDIRVLELETLRVWGKRRG